MSETPVPDAAVQIATPALRSTTRRTRLDDAQAVVAALARAGWLHDPAEVAALRAVADAADELFWAVKSNDEPQSPRLVVAMREAGIALDALPPADGVR